VDPVRFSGCSESGNLIGNSMESGLSAFGVPTCGLATEVKVRNENDEFHHRSSASVKKNFRTMR